MCGIVGFIGDQRGVDPEAALKAIAHRGPDAEGRWASSTRGGTPLWLGHRRLAIIDLSPLGRQPMHDASGRFTVVFNGELYNYAEVRKELEAYGVSFRSGSDTEVLVAAFARWGDGCLARFRGMFAFALWDARDETLTLARDRLGEKPLYYVSDARRFAFASEVRALLTGGFVAREIDPDGLDSLLTFGSVADPFSLVRDVKSVAPGEVLTFSHGRLARRRYWSLADIAVDPSRRRDEAVAGVRERLSRSLRNVMVGDVPVAVLLSGGIDSSANVVLLSEQHWQNLATFSVTFGGADSAHSEKPYSDLVAQRFGTRHQSVEVSLDEARALVPRALDAMDMPSVDGVNVYLVTHAIRQAGITVAVSGQGSDELFLGYPQRERFGLLSRGGKAVPGALRRALLPWRNHLGLRPDSPVEKAFQWATEPHPVGAAYLAQHSMFTHAGVERLRGATRPPTTRFVAQWEGLDVDPLNLLSRIDLGTYLRNTLLRDGDQMSMAHAVEVRAPFLDADLVEWVLSTPTRHKLDRRRNKPLLLDAVGPALPREVWDRPKKGFGIPYQRWLREGLELAEIEGPEVGLDPRAVAEVRARFAQGQYYSRWLTLLAYARWARRERMGTRHLR
ncbi:MAG: asparagine synthase (glutamine-hydrolyzing) [Myxococcales bacterium]|nr:asparagine synthase (glutamine-hydrolyzing) [Myxococcales bacterium]